MVPAAPSLATERAALHGAAPATLMRVPWRVGCQSCLHKAPDLLALIG